MKYGTKEEDGGRRDGWYCKEYAHPSTREIKMPRHTDGGHAGVENQRERGRGRHRGMVRYSEYGSGKLHTLCIDLVLTKPQMETRGWWRLAKTSSSDPSLSSS